MRLFMRHPLLGQTAAEMSRAVIIELPRASSLRGADCLVPGIRRAGVPKIAPNFATLRDERERERELLETICHWHKFGEEEGLFVTTLTPHRCANLFKARGVCIHCSYDRCSG